MNIELELDDFAEAPPVSAAAAAATARLLADPKQRERVWMLQWYSHQPGGLKQVAWEWWQSNQHNCASPTMRRIGTPPDGMYRGDEYEAICGEIGSERFPTLPMMQRTMEGLQPKPARLPPRIIFREPTEFELFLSHRREQERAEMFARLRPENRCASFAALNEECRRQVLMLAPKLRRLCLDAKESWNAPYFADLAATMMAWHQGRVAAASADFIETETRTSLEKNVEFARASRQLVVLHGAALIGKTTATRLLQTAHPGWLRLISLEQAPTEEHFIAQVMKGLCGDAPSQGDAATPLCDAAGGGELVIIIDHAEHLFATSERLTQQRFELIQTQLCGRGVPVVLIGGPDFETYKKASDKRGRFIPLFKQAYRCTIIRPPTAANIITLIRHAFTGTEIPEKKLKQAADFILAQGNPFVAFNRVVQEYRNIVAKSAAAKPVDDFARAVNFALNTYRHLLGTAAGSARSNPAPSVKPPAELTEPADVGGTVLPVS